MLSRRKKKQYESDIKCVQEFTEDTLSGGLSLEERVAVYAAERERRVENFVQLVRARREQFIERACTTNV